ncbi:thioesterase-like superfamily-domain-containing protein [Hyaloraphidium curvatum]|nr:thioesterase-like superfamily-domain-containing protein [Hyaloraphidium curvatum]
MSAEDPFSAAVAVSRHPSSPPGSNPAVWTGVIRMPGPGSATAAIAFSAVLRELEAQGSPCTQPINFTADMLSGVRLGDRVEVEVERTREGGRFAFLRATLWNLGQPSAAQGGRKAAIATCSAVFTNPARTPGSPPFPPGPAGGPPKPPDFDACSSLQELAAKYRRPNAVVSETWDWKVTPEWAARYGKVVEEAEAEGKGAGHVRRRIADWAQSLDHRTDGWYYYHLSGRPCDPLSCLFFSDIIPARGFLLLNVAGHHDEGFPFLTLRFSISFMQPIDTNAGLTRGLWARLRFKGDFGDMEEREVVLRDELGRPVCVGRQDVIHRRPLGAGEKL